MDTSETTQSQVDLFTAVYNLVQAQGQTLSALMETQNRLMQSVVQGVAKNTERLDNVILKFEDLLRRGGIDGVAPTGVHPFVTEPPEPKPSAEQPKNTTEELPPPAPVAEEEQPKKTTEELPPSAPVIEEEQPTQTTEELTPPASFAEEEHPENTMEELTPPAALVEEEEPKKTTEELTPPAPVVEEEQPTQTTEELTPPTSFAEAEHPEKTTEELNPPAPFAEEEQPTQATEELPPSAPIVEEEQPTQTTEVLTPTASFAEEEHSEKTTEELTSRAAVVEEEEPKKTTEELTSPAPFAEEEQSSNPPVTAEAHAAPPVQRYDPNELLLVRGSNHLPPVNAKDKETFLELGIGKSQQSAAPPAIQENKPPAVPVEDDWEAPVGAPSRQLPQQPPMRQDDYSQHQQTWNNGARSQRGTGLRGGFGPRGAGCFGGARGGAMPPGSAFQPSTNAPPPSYNNGVGQQRFGDQPSGAPGGNFAKGGDDFTANGHGGGGGFGRGGGRGGPGPRGAAPYRGGGFGGTPRGGGGPGGFNNAPQRRGSDASQGFDAQPGFDKPQFGGGGYDGNENKMPNFRPTTNGPPVHSNVNNGFNGGDGGFSNPPQQQAAPRDNGFQPPQQQQQARPFGAAPQPRGGGNFYNASSCRGGRGAFPRR